MEEFEIITLKTNEETGEPEITMHNRLARYMSKEYQIIDYQNSWKKCHCGRITRLNDNWCPACGQKLGMPIIEDE